MLKKIYCNWEQEQERYFAAGQQDIIEANLRTLIQVSFAATVMVTIFLWAASLIISGWKPTLAHLLFAPIMACFCLVSVCYARRGKRTARTVNLLCTLFVACLFLLIICIDVFQYRNQPSSFMAVVLIAVPALFVFRFPYIYLELLFFEVIYLVSLYAHKVRLMAQNDCFNSLVGMVISVVVGILIQRLRAESYNAQRQYRQLSMTDGLTGILNKSNCEMSVRKWLEDRRDDEKCALLILDIDNFKHINDTLGHKAGDRVLEALGAMLLQSFRSSDTVGRIGGDEFMILMRGLQDDTAVRRKWQKLSGNMQELANRCQVELTCSIGAVFLEGQTISYENLFRIADDALYEAKATGKARYALHSAHPGENA